MKGSEGRVILNISFASPSQEKQKEILDAIHYAKRIQLAQIPSEKRVAKMIQKLKGNLTR
jgi:hypothetical protein